jgi:hypothetical protein
VIVTGWAAPAQSPAYSGPAITDWRALPQSAMFVIPGVAMVAVLDGGARSARRQATASAQA